MTSYQVEPRTLDLLYFTIIAALIHCLSLIQGKSSVRLSVLCSQDSRNLPQHLDEVILCSYLGNKAGNYNIRFL